MSVLSQIPVQPEAGPKLQGYISIPERVTETDYWEKYYQHESGAVYEWNDGVLEEKTMSKHATVSIYHWFNELLDHYLRTCPVAEKTSLDMGFRLVLTHKTVVRRPDMGIVRHDNPVQLRPNDASFHGIFNACIEVLSDIEPGAKERDTVTKKAEYAGGGVKEYFILYAEDTDAAFYRLDENRMLYIPIEQDDRGVIKSEVLPGFQFRRSDLYSKPSPEEMTEDAV
ncbi:MAG: Uma2 family endonuclease, partial [Gammaproteobacteria bacterium]|nr:Uma2 family endonuclease [Gammaproteobacteria bacterium]